MTDGDRRVLIALGAILVVNLVVAAVLVVGVWVGIVG